jgi:hypothetical protein
MVLSLTLPSSSSETDLLGAVELALGDAVDARDDWAFLRRDTVFLLSSAVRSRLFASCMAASSAGLTSK